MPQRSYFGSGRWQRDDFWITSRGTLIAPLPRLYRVVVYFVSPRKGINGGPFRFKFRIALQFMQVGQSFSFILINFLAWTTRWYYYKGRGDQGFRRERFFLNPPKEVSASKKPTSAVVTWQSRCWVRTSLLYKKLRSRKMTFISFCWNEPNQYRKKWLTPTWDDL